MNLPAMLPVSDTLRRLTKRARARERLQRAPQPPLHHQQFDRSWRATPSRSPPRRWRGRSSPPARRCRPTGTCPTATGRAAARPARRRGWKGRGSGPRIGGRRCSIRGGSGGLLRERGGERQHQGRASENDAAHPSNLPRHAPFLVHGHLLELTCGCDNSTTSATPNFSRRFDTTKRRIDPALSCLRRRGRFAAARNPPITSSDHGHRLA